MIKRKIYLLIPFLVLLVIASCKFAPDAVNTPNWQMDILGPLVNTSANGNSIVQMNTLNGTASVSIKKLTDTTGTGLNIPAIHVDSIPRFHFQLFNAFKSLTLEKGMMYFTLDNNLPVTLKIGTRITIIDSISGEVLMSVPLASDVAANGGHYVFTTGVNLAGDTIESNLFISITNINTDASNGPATITGNENFTVSAFLEGATLESCTVFNDSIEFRDTSAFSLQGYKVKTDVQSGTITVFITNGLPFDMSLQFYFLKDDGKTIIDSLFNIGGTNIFAKVGSQPDTSSLVFTITNAKLDNLNNAKYIYSDIHVKNSSPNLNSGITLSKTDSINFLLVGNLQVKLN